MTETKQNYTGCDSKKQVGPKRPTFHKKALHKSHYPWTQRQVMWPNTIVEYALIELNRKASSEKISFINKEYNIEEEFIAMKKRNETIVLMSSLCICVFFVFVFFQ